MRGYYNDHYNDRRDLLTSKPEDDPRIRSNIDSLFKKTKKGWLKSEKTERPKKIFKKIIKEASYCIALAYVICCVIAYYKGLTFDSESSLDMFITAGSLAFAGIFFFWADDRIKSPRLLMLLFLLVTFGVLFLTLTVFPTLHIYDVTSNGDVMEVNYKCSLGQANIGNIHLRSKVGRYFIVNSTDEYLDLVAREYTVVETTSRKKDRTRVEYTYTGRAYEKDPLSLGVHDRTVRLIKPHLYYTLQLNDWNIMRAKFGLPSNECVIKSEYRGVEKIYPKFDFRWS